MKRCYTCKTNKPLEEFYKSCPECKICRRERNKQQHAKNRDKNLTRMKERYKADPVRSANESRNNRTRGRLLPGAVFDDTITLHGVIERDGNICQICMKPIEGGSVEKNPSIDHKTPLSRGGDHTWKNVQLAHRGCNSQKYNKDESQ